MKKALSIIKTTLVWLVVLLAVSMMIFTVISVTTFNRNDRDLFGYKMYIVNTDSMKDTFAAGSLILVKEIDPATLQEGDIITFMSQDTDSFGETITHKIRKLTTDAEGKPGFITYGTTTDVDDETIVTYPYVLGKYQSHISGLGTFFNFLKTTPGYFLCIFTPFMLIILYEGIKFFNLFRRYKKEQMEEMQAEKDKIEQEKAENAKMLEELKALKAQLEGQQTAAKPAEPAPAPVEAEAPVEEAPAEEAPAEEAKEEAPAEAAPAVEEVKEEAPAEEDGTKEE
ncbi:MAG: signal peptidase I [Clostridia bacterium]|nr:signal peptidase I [Clostridia bacterium]